MTEEVAIGPRERSRDALLELFPKGSVGAEIGVSTGIFSVRILERVQPSKLVLIDPWDLLAQQPPKGAPEHAWYLQAETMADKFYAVMDMFHNDSRVSVMRGFSQEIMRAYPDNFFDWVYIDGSHRYDDVIEELAISIKKVKLGGLITGDDLWHGENGQKEVLRAVHETLSNAGLPRKLDALDRENLPDVVTQPSRLSQQFILPVLPEMRS